MSMFEPRDWDGRIFLGEWRAGAGGDRAVSSPATGEELGRIGLAAPEDMSRAADRAVEGQRQWAALPYDRRAAVMRRAGDLWMEHAPEIHDWLARETGSIRPKAEFETYTGSQECYEAAALASHPYGELLRSVQPRLSFARRVPVGVVGVIAPFNAPIILSVRAVAPALALGNAVILKPDPRTSVSGGVAVARIFEEAGLPAGVLSVLPGGVDVGQALIVEPRVRVIAFTGSTAAGRAVAALAGQHLKRVHLELGGNSALIVLDDVDLDAAASVGAFGSYFHQGQICMASSRHLVDARVVDAYVARLAEHADRLPVGDPMRQDVAVGPMIDARQRDQVHEVVTASTAAGARLAAGGTYEGLYYRPTVLADVPLEAPAYRQEIFGPVAPVVSFGSLDEAVRLATDTEYGLSLAILAKDVSRALELAERIPSGAVHINDQTINDEAQIPFGGVKDSGNGSRAGSPQANLDAFTETQWVTVRSGLPDYPF
jgi:benzaldehyde dehydrogenase (NAD)